MVCMRKAIAKVVITKELMTIPGGHAFDSDRHGNQLRIEINPLTHKIVLGLYDFGELSLDKPTETELHQLARFIRDLPSAVMKSLLLSSFFDSLMSSHINMVIDNGQSPAYLMRIRKAFLALQDFQADLSTLDLIEIIKHIYDIKSSHLIIQNAIADCMEFINKAESVCSTAQAFTAPLRMFDREATEITTKDLPRESLAQLC